MVVIGGSLGLRRGGELFEMVGCEGDAFRVAIGQAVNHFKWDENGGGSYSLSVGDNGYHRGKKKGKIAGHILSGLNELSNISGPKLGGRRLRFYLPLYTLEAAFHLLAHDFICKTQLLRMLSFCKRQGQDVEHLLLGKASNLGLDKVKYIFVEHKFVLEFPFPITQSLPPYKNNRELPHYLEVWLMGGNECIVQILLDLELKLKKFLTEFGLCPHRAGAQISKLATQGEKCNHRGEKLSVKSQKLLKCLKLGRSDICCLSGAMKSGLGINATNLSEEDRGEELQHKDEVQSGICDGVETHTTCEVNDPPIVIDESDTTNKNS
ncbi:hypothetical protein GOBAR_AA39815 [Gossypium barbadense]|uniref:Uncharacterized protein n=1 Tax=Gossypium barbadense TaxID=3634 RepID=A0A2P5VPX9_GOSBA|nr:hypothetical protein GOBAR_AA39815 [Gossypium barbadense]